MANLGTAQTKNFQIGNAELRIGKMGEAGRLTQKGHSVGLLQSANVNFSQQMAELKGGLPLQLVDSVITETTVTVSAQAYEYTRRNIRAMLNEGVKANEADYTFTGVLSADPDANALVEGLFGADPSQLPTTAGTPAVSLRIDNCMAVPGSNAVPTGYLANAADAVTYPSILLGIYKKGAPEHLSIVQAKTVNVTTGIPTGSATGAVVLLIDSKTPLLFDYADETEVVVYTINQVGLGNSEATQYYTIDLLSKNHNSGNTQGFRFWKASIQGGMDYSFSNDSFAVTPLSFKVLLPTTSDLEATGDNGLGHLPPEMFTTNKLGMFWTGQSV